MNVSRRPARTGAPMHGFCERPFARLRVGIVGVGWRGMEAVRRLPVVPGVEIAAICDISETRLALAQNYLKKENLPTPRLFTGSHEAYRALCASSGVDIVYVTTPWLLHVPVALEALAGGKYAFVEVPAALTVEDCWALVEASEKFRRPCMMLENCCYGEQELLGLSLVRRGILGELLHGEGGYCHDLRPWCYNDKDESREFQDAYWNHWRLKFNAAHDGNPYPTHGFGPICQAMDINRGDRLEYLVSLSSKSAGFTEYAREKYGPTSAQARQTIALGDVNTTLLKTARGRSIQIRHNVSTAQGCYRFESLIGTKGAWYGVPDRLYFEGNGAPATKGHAFFDAATYEEMRVKYRHPLWTAAGALATKIGGHDGMDVIMDLRWAYCLQKGLPLDFDVYDLASWCSVCELSEKSCRSGAMPQQIPDFTRGAWAENTPETALTTVEFPDLTENASI